MVGSLEYGHFQCPDILWAVMRGEFVRVSPKTDETENKLRKNPMKNVQIAYINFSLIKLEERARDLIQNFVNDVEAEAFALQEADETVFSLVGGKILHGR